MLSSRLFFLFSCVFVFLTLACAAPMVQPDDLAKRIAEPQNGMGGSGKDWKREAQNGMGGSGKDWKREPEAEADPQGGFGGFSKDWKREAEPQPQGFGGVSKDWKREPQGGFGGFGKDW
ncbi:hypothetical protein ACEPAI_1123 [Sanghuangporus weigelae]